MSRTRRTRKRSFLPQVEALGQRIAPTVTAFFVPATGVLRISGDNLNNVISVGRALNGRIAIGAPGLHVIGKLPTVAQTKQIIIDGRGGNDIITLNEARGL